MWVEQLKDNNDTNSIILLGNKSDLNTKRVISKEEGIKLAEKLNYHNDKSKIKFNG